MMTICAISQSNYIPWKGYFQLIFEVKDVTKNLKISQNSKTCFKGFPEVFVNAQTGIEYIDKSISDLYSSGYMHNHIRMYVSSLICNFSNTHFLNPSKWMYYHLLDGDVASNCLNWQWVSGASRNKKYFFNQDNLNIGFESQHMSFSYYEALSKSLSNISWVSTESIVENIAAVKDSTEIDSLKTAIEITDEVFTKILPEIKEGVTEKYIATRISYLFKMNGAEGDSYESIIAGGPRSALPHARPTEREFIKGDLDLLDFS